MQKLLCVFLLKANIPLANKIQAVGYINLQIALKILLLLHLHFPLNSLRLQLKSRRSCSLTMTLENTSSPCFLISSIIHVLKNNSSLSPCLPPASPTAIYLSPSLLLLSVFHPIVQIFLQLCLLQFLHSVTLRDHLNTNALNSQNHLLRPLLFLRFFHRKFLLIILLFLFESLVLTQVNVLPYTLNIHFRFD